MPERTKTDDWMIENRGQVRGTMVTSKTLLYVPLGDPFESAQVGNQFSMHCDDGNEYKIVNFLFENLEKVNRLGVPWPFNVLVLGDGVAAIHDARIPDRWYKKDWVQCPYHLLPAHQKLELMRDVQTGALQRKNGQWIHFIGAKPDRLPLEPPPESQVHCTICGPLRPGLVIANLEGIARAEFTRGDAAQGEGSTMQAAYDNAELSKRDRDMVHKIKKLATDTLYNLINDTEEVTALIPGKPNLRTHHTRKKYMSKGAMAPKNEKLLWLAVSDLIATGLFKVRRYDLETPIAFCLPEPVIAWKGNELELFLIMQYYVKDTSREK